MKQSLRLSVVKALGGMPLGCKLCWLFHRFKVWTLIIDSFIWIAKTMLCRIFHRKQHTQALFPNSDFVRPTLVRKEGPKLNFEALRGPLPITEALFSIEAGPDGLEELSFWPIGSLRKAGICSLWGRVVFVLSQATFLSTGQRELLAIRTWTFGEGQVQDARYFWMVLPFAGSRVFLVSESSTSVLGTGPNTCSHYFLRWHGGTCDFWSFHKSPMLS